ncbi:2'-5' RNA ligase family protein [Luteolibacter marinus]|uniref:2'-5' RNA ligase family protein n=1 Tax=Luteolibacter marinus TaxID=2776705 RepID=UPI001868052B|nr:2'-5' RNA ligase family protein [Luteolibacter marinus]
MKTLVFRMAATFRLLLPAVSVAMALLPVLALIQPAAGEEAPPVTAIDILLEPDATMLKHAAANNERLRKVYPAGFALDEAHSPHITLLQCFVRTADLDKVYDAAGKVLADAGVASMKLEAFKYYYAPADEKTGVAGICAKPTDAIVKLQADIITAVKPFTVETATVSAFSAPHPSPDLDQALIDYVSTFDPKMSGKNFNPHVSTGVAPKDYIEKMMAEPFDNFTFSPAGAAVYQLGPFGAAARKLKQWEFK